jgi:hypothetical protein
MEKTFLASYAMEYSEISFDIRKGFAPPPPPPPPTIHASYGPEPTHTQTNICYTTLITQEAI